MIVAAYAGCGKTHFAHLMKDEALDLECVPYKYLPNENCVLGEAGKANPDSDMNPAWPLNYVKAIIQAMESYKYVLIPSDFYVLGILQTKDIPYTLVYPRRDAKEEYRRRYIARGNTENFLSIFYEHWDYFMDNLEADNYGKRIVLLPHQYLSDVLIRQ